ncbi:MAG TPA: fluoride efflux transporter CrcB [Planctomycetaceae bacterium]|nr:fluoride efflux transporter CrcB [Blastopirellula sp.]HAY81663.1 fluoride efflux transporter CrcB [Planctomycetaceae bacterium]
MRCGVMFQPMIVLAIGIGGAVGAITRYTVTSVLRHLLGESFPYGTLLVNLLGCFALGCIAELAATWNETHPDRLPAWLHRGITIGLLGALTTFSTFGHETIRHLERQEYLAGFLNIAVSVLVGLCAVAVGIAVARSFAN